VPPHSYPSASDSASLSPTLRALQIKFTYLLTYLFQLSVPVQVIAWRGLSPKCPVMYRAGRKPLLIHSELLPPLPRFTDYPTHLPHPFIGKIVYIYAVMWIVCMWVDDEEDEVKPSVVTSKHVCLELQVPHHAVGAVIGSQGSQIKQVLTLPNKKIGRAWCWSGNSR